MYMRTFEWSHTRQYWAKSNTETTAIQHSYFATSLIQCQTMKQAQISHTIVSNFNKMCYVRLLEYNHKLDYLTPKLHYQSRIAKILITGSILNIEVTLSTLMLIAADKRCWKNQTTTHEWKNNWMFCAAWTYSVFHSSHCHKNE